MTNKGTVAEKLGEVQLARTRTVKGISNIEICLSCVELAISSEGWCIQTWKHRLEVHTHS